MTTYQIYNYKHFNLNELSYEQPIKSRGNSYNCLVDKPFDILFQTKDTILKTGIVQRTWNENQAHIDIDVAGTDLEEFMKRLDEHNINYIFKKCVDWFDHELPYETIKEFYISNIVDGVLRLSIPVVRKKIDIKVFDNKKRLINHDELKPGSKVVLVFRINGLKFLKKECLMDLDVVQIMLMRPTETTTIPTQKILNQSEENGVPIAQNVEQPQNPKPVNEVLTRIQFRDNLKKQKELARQAFEDAEKAQLEADRLKEYAARLAKELKEMEDDYYREEEEVYEDDSEEDS